MYSPGEEHYCNVQYCTVLYCTVLYSPGEEHQSHRVGHHEDGEEVGGWQLASREGADSTACKATLWFMNL